MDYPDFSKANHTIILSDVHLADAEPPHPKNPLWKRFKRKKLFTDRTFRTFLEYLSSNIEGPIELVLNGDIFDFDSVMKMPKTAMFKTNWLERRRGLAAEEPKSRFKVGIIMTDHNIWVAALREFILKGNRVIFIIGNHDVELHWPGVQYDIVQRLDLPGDLRKNVRFCEWFYISNQDTIIEHGNQYDVYCLCQNPIHPLIRSGLRVTVRLPFGNIAGKIMLNGMGLMNPHVDTSFIKESLKDYVVHFMKYVITTQPFLVWTWFWSSAVTMIMAIGEGLSPALKDPLMVEQRIEDIAARSNANPSMVRALRELHVHPAIFSPFRILKELWLDRAFFFVLIWIGCFQLVATLNVLLGVSMWWFLVPLTILMPIFLFYARSVQSEVAKAQKTAIKKLPISTQMANVRRAVHGHTHVEKHSVELGVEYLNTGTWSPAFHDVECTQPYGRKCFAWIRPGKDGNERVADLYEWKASGEAEKILID